LLFSQEEPPVLFLNIFLVRATTAVFENVWQLLNLVYLKDACPSAVTITELSKAPLGL
jgi:hypothetical protein